MITEPVILYITNHRTYKNVPFNTGNIVSYVKLYDRELVHINQLGLVDHFLYRNCDVINLATDEQRLVFKYMLDVRGWLVSVKITLVVKPLSDTRTFLSYYYRKGISMINIGLFIAALNPNVEATVTRSLSIMDIQHLPVGVPIADDVRHFEIKSHCKAIGLELLNDQLVIEGISLMIALHHE